jgi:hypothetical protein
VWRCLSYFSKVRDPRFDVVNFATQFSSWQYENILMLNWEKWQNELL